MVSKREREKRKKKIQGFLVAIFFLFLGGLVIGYLALETSIPDATYLFGVIPFGTFYVIFGLIFLVLTIILAYFFKSLKC